MFQTKSNIIFSSLLFIMLAGCQKENNIEPGLNNIPLYIKSIDDSTQSEIFTYSSGKLITFEKIKNYQQIFTFVVTYDTSKRIKTENVNFLSPPEQEKYSSFLYDENSRLLKIISQTKIDNAGFTPSGYSEFKYNNQNQVIRIEQYWPEGIMMYYYEYKYNAEGNVTECGLYMGAVLDTKTTYTYDDKINPLWALQNSYFWGISFSKNNILSSRTEFYNQSTTIENYSYEYNGQDYPVKKTTERTDTYTGHSVGVSTYSYY